MTAVKISTLPVVIFFKIYMYTYIVIFGCAGSLLLLGLFSRYEKQGLLSSCGVRASHCSGFSCCRAQALGHAGFHSCSPWAPEHRLNSCGTRVKLLCSMWDLSGSSIEPVSPALVVDSLPLSQQGQPISGYFLKQQQQQKWSEGKEWQF